MGSDKRLNVGIPHLLSAPDSNVPDLNTSQQSINQNTVANCYLHHHFSNERKGCFYYDLFYYHLSQVVGENQMKFKINSWDT